MALHTAQHVETAPPGRKKRKARWNIEARLRDALMVRAVMILADKETSHNAVCKASALLVRAEAQNQKDEQRKKKRTPKKNIPVVRRGWPGEEAQQSEVGDQRPEVGDQKPEVGDQKPEVGDQRSEVGDQKPEVGDQRPEVGDQRPEVGDQRSEVKSQDAKEVVSNGAAEASSVSRRKRARRWNIKPEYRDLMVLRWSRIVADPKASQTALFAVGALMMRAEAQNQKDEEYRRKNKHRCPKQIVVEFTRDFYGNNAHELAAARAAAEASANNPAAEAKADIAVAGTKEDRDLRPEVKQDAGKAGGLGPQSWYATGPPARRG
jgi:hypothetical protein